MKPKKTIREAVAVLFDAKSLEAAIDELEERGFDRSHISLLAAENTVNEKLGHFYRRVAELEDNPDVARVGYVSRESLGAAEGGLIGGLMYVGATTAAGAVVLSGGALGAAIAASVLIGGAGAALGGVLARLIAKDHADYIANQVEHGGLLLWVRTVDAEHETRAIEILSKHSAHDIHIHSLPYGHGEMLIYKGVEIERFPGGACFAANKLFDSLSQAQMFIDRRGHDG